MRTIVTLALFLVVGFVGSRGFVTRATHRLPLAGMLATGMEFFLLGILLGPNVLNLITDRVLADLEPIIYLTLGWIGLMFGVELSWEQVRKISRGVFRFLLIETAAFVLAFSTLFYFVIQWAWPDLSGFEHFVAAALFGITAATSSPTVIAVVTQRLPARGELTNTMRLAGALSALFPLLAFGLLFMVLHPRFLDVEGLGFGVLWWLFSNGVGLALGFLMVLFTWERATGNEMLLLILGAVFLIGGVCYFLDLSSIYTAMVAGAVVGNFSRKRDQIFRELHRIEKTLFFGLLVVVGTLVDFTRPLVLLVVILLYVGFRFLMKFTVTGSAVMVNCPNLRPHGRKSGLVLSGQGVMAMAIALDCTLASPDQSLSWALTVVALAVFVNDLAGFGIARRLFVASGEVGPARKGAR